MKDLPGFARAYVTITSLCGVGTLAMVLAHWHPGHPLQFLFYLTLAAICSNLKVSLPGINSTMSVNFLFILIGVTELTLAETLAIGCISSMAQSFLRARMRPKVVQLVFNVSSLTLASAASYAAFHSELVRRIDSSLALLLFLASTIFFLVNTISISGIIALAEGKRLWRVWYESFFWTAPQYLLGAALAAFIHWVNRYLGWQSSFLVFPIIYLIYRSYRLYLGRLDEEKKHVSAMANLHLRTIEALALAIDAKDETTHSHMRRVQVYATEIAKELGAGEMVIQALQAAALLHDIGKLAVPEYIISKPGRLTPEEFEKMKIHPVVGAEILETVQFPYPVVPVVRSHHEKWDGTGYPDGKKGVEIPLGARILAAVDCLDALASDRQYRRALSLDKAMEFVVSESGKSFDPQVVHILRQRYQELERMAKVSSTGLSKLSIKLRVERGQAPDAGFEETGSTLNGQPQHDRADFLGMIAGARQEFQMLLEMTNELGSTLSLDETLSILATRLKNMVPYDAIAIYLRRGEKLVSQYASGENFRLFSSLEIPMGQGLSGWVAENKLPIINGNPSVEPGYLNDPTKFSTMRSALAVPLEGLTEVVGTLTLYRSESDAFTKDHLRMLLAISSKAGLTIENAVHHSKIEKSAVTDELTGLPNARSLFLKLDAELARCKRSGAALTVMVLDLDGFKQVNDRFGHLEGNKVLQLTAARLKDSCREYDYVGRMGGDEFVVLLPESDRPALESKAQLFCDIVVAVGHEVCGEDVLSLSVGESFFPHDGSDAEELLAQADKRMYQVKRTHHSTPKLSSEKPVRLVLTPAG